MGRLAVHELRQLRDFLTDVEKDYRNYIKVQRADKRATGWRKLDLDAQRASLVRRAARAQRAVNASGFQLRILPPPVLGDPMLTALPQQMFAHETSEFACGVDPLVTAAMVLDGFGVALGALDDKIAQAEFAAAAEPAARIHGPARRQLPTLWGRLRRLPAGIAITADVVTVCGVAVGVLRMLNIL
jgi:hypothetical protein